MVLRVLHSSGLASAALGVAAYLIAIALAGLVTVLGARGVATAVLSQIGSPRAHATLPAAKPQEAAPAAVASAPAPPIIASQVASMTPLQGRWQGRWGREYAWPPPRGYRAAPFGSSSRYGHRPLDPFERLFGDDGNFMSAANYRTVCVRLCDGYYFPVSFSVAREHFDRDRQVCENRCGGQGRLFAYRNPGGVLEDMEDLAGRPYRQLRTAFLYRSEYVESCRCQPHPWEVAAQTRHRVYALAAAARKGSKDAIKELQSLQAEARRAPPAGAPSDVPPDRGTFAARDGEIIMRLGADDERSKAQRPAERPRGGRDREWLKRAFDPQSGG